MFLEATKIDVRHILTLGSRLMMRTVLSESPTAKNLDLCSPAGTRPTPMQMTSLFISFLSVYSFSWPVCGKDSLLVRQFIYQLDI